MNAARGFHHAASELTINGRCNALASSHGARIQTSRSSSVVRITGWLHGIAPRSFIERWTKRTFGPVRAFG
jgi:hypothetical protein